MKSIVTSDIHIGNYSDFEFGAGFRANQFIQLANRLVREGKKQGTKTLFIAGDTIDRPINGPRLINLLWRFFRILTEWFDDIQIIYGQHDLDSKSNDYLASDSIICLLEDFSQVHYAHDTIKEYGGKKVYFSNFQFSKEISCNAKEFVDVWISHVTLDKAFGQVIVNPEQFKLGIFGDIHTPVEDHIATGDRIADCYSINVPIQKDLRDSRVPTIGVLDFDNLSFTRVPSLDSEFNPLVIAYDDEYISEDYVNVKRVARPIKSIASALTAQESDELFNLDKHLDTAVPEKYQELLKQVRARLANVTFDRYSLDFEVTKLWAKNYWSVKEVEFNFEGKTLVNFIGRNGSGKTTVTKILLSLFQPKADLKYKADQFMNPPEPVEVGGELRYLGATYKIIRNSATGTKFWINGEEISKNSQPALEKYINEVLPFTQMMNFFILKNGSEFFSAQNRVKLVYQAFNLDQLQKYANTAQEIFVEFNKVRNDLKIECNKLEGSISATTDLVTKLETEITELKSSLKVGNVSEAYPRYEKLKKEITETETQVNTLVANMPIADTSITAEEAANLETTLKANQEAYSKWYTDWQNSRNLKNKYYDKLHEIEKAIADGVCPTCHRPYNNDPEHEAELKKERETVNNAIESVVMPDAELGSKLDKDIKEMQKKLETYHANQKLIEKANEMQAKVDELKVKLTELKSDRLIQYEEVLKRDWVTWTEMSNKNNQLIEAKASLEKYQSELNQKSAEVEKAEANANKAQEFSSLLNPRNNDGVAVKLVTKLCELISNEQIKFKFESNNVVTHLKVQNQWIIYDRTSGGQRIVSDLLILQRFLKLLGRVGFISFDEFLSPCDPVSFEECTKAMEDLDYNLAFYISQQDTFNINCKKIHCELIDNYSQYTQTY